jgi:hypothetical protein
MRDRRERFDGYGRCEFNGDYGWDFHRGFDRGPYGSRYGEDYDYQRVEDYVREQLAGGRRYGDYDRHSVPSDFDERPRHTQGRTYNHYDRVDYEMASDRRRR